VFVQCHRTAYVVAIDLTEIVLESPLQVLPGNAAKPASTTPRAKQRCSGSVSVAGDRRLHVGIIFLLPDETAGFGWTAHGATKGVII